MVFLLSVWLSLVTNTLSIAMTIDYWRGYCKSNVITTVSCCHFATSAYPGSHSITHKVNPQKISLTLLENYDMETVYSIGPELPFKIFISNNLQHKKCYHFRAFNTVMRHQFDNNLSVITHNLVNDVFQV